MGHYNFRIFLFLIKLLQQTDHVLIMSMEQIIVSFILQLQWIDI